MRMRYLPVIVIALGALALAPGSVLGAGLPVLLVFWRRECAPCDQLAPALDRLARSTAGRALIAKIKDYDIPDYRSLRRKS